MVVLMVLLQEGMAPHRSRWVDATALFGTSALLTLRGLRLHTSSSSATTTTLARRPRQDYIILGVSASGIIFFIVRLGCRVLLRRLHGSEHHDTRFPILTLAKKVRQKKLRKDHWPATSTTDAVTTTAATTTATGDDVFSSHTLIAPTIHVEVG